MTEKSARLQVDLLLETLSHHRRRHIITYIVRSDKEIFYLDDFAQLIATQESKSPNDAAPNHEEAKINLHHRHIPKLVDARILEYDPGSGEIRYRGIPGNDLIDVSQLLNIQEETIHNIDL